jgi:hypothetical protein
MTALTRTPSPVHTSASAMPTGPVGRVIFASLSSGAVGAACSVKNTDVLGPVVAGDSGIPRRLAPAVSLAWPSPRNVRMPPFAAWSAGGGPRDPTQGVRKMGCAAT